MSVAGFELTSLLIALIIAIVAGLFRGFAGFGSGLIMAPIMTWAMPPSVAVPIMLILSLAASARLVPEVRDDVRWGRVMWLAVPAAIGIPIGSIALVELDGPVLQKLVSGVVLAMVLLLATGWRYPGTPGGRVLVPVGLFSGALTGIGGVGGPPVVAVMMSEDADARRIRADLIGFFVFSQVIAVSTFLVRGLVTGHVLIGSAFLAPLFVVSIHIGSRVFGGQLQGWYRAVAMALLAVVAATGLLL